LIHDAAETPDPIKTRQLTDDEALRVMKALDTPERRHTLPVFIAAMDTGARKSSLLDYLCWKEINFGDEIITLTAYKGKGRNIKPKRWPVQMTSRLKKELLQLQLQRKNKNDDALCLNKRRSIYASCGLRHTPKRQSRKVHATSTLCVTTSVPKWLMKVSRYQRLLIC
jgi:hypothetical protein